MMDDLERMANAHHLLVQVEEDAVATQTPLHPKVSLAIDALESEGPATPGYVYRATGTRVIDGDTFVASIDLGFRISFNCIVRVHGMNAPEAGKPGAGTSKAMLEQMVLSKRILVSSYKDERSFERWVCDVWNVEGPKPLNVARRMIEAGRATPFAKGDKWSRS